MEFLRNRTLLEIDILRSKIRKESDKNLRDTFSKELGSLQKFFKTVAISNKGMTRFVR